MVAIKDIEIPSSCYDCSFVKNKRTNDYGSFCECGILEDCETINLLEHSKHPKCPLIEIQERKVGEWCKQNDDYFDWYECSECGYGSEGEMQYSSECDVRTKYCPNCGAEMRGSENG